MEISKLLSCFRDTARQLAFLAASIAGIGALTVPLVAYAASEEPPHRRVVLQQWLDKQLGPRGIRDSAPWFVEFLGPEDCFDDGKQQEHCWPRQWNFQSTRRSDGLTKSFRVQTDVGRFVHSYVFESITLIFSDIGSGGWGVILYDLDANRKVADFYTAFPRLSPDNRYLAYRKWVTRVDSPDPQLLIIDLKQDIETLSQMRIRSPARGVGTSIYPPPESTISDTVAMQDYVRRHESHYYYSLDGVLWDMENQTFFFVAPDSTGYRNLIVLLLEAPSPTIVCYVPLIRANRQGEFSNKGFNVNPRNLVLQPPNTIVATMRESGGVQSFHTIKLDVACRGQDTDFTDKRRDIWEKINS